jgi:hypothetical protein
MSETRRDALKLSVCGALGLTACVSDHPRGLTITPVAESQQPDIMIHTQAGNVSGSWVLLQYDTNKGVYYSSINTQPLLSNAPGNKPDLGSATSNPGYWQPYPAAAGNLIPVYGTGLAFRLDADGTTTSSALAAFVQGNQQIAAQKAWNEIGLK